MHPHNQQQNKITYSIGMPINKLGNWLISKQFNTPLDTFERWVKTLTQNNIQLHTYL